MSSLNFNNFEEMLELLGDRVVKTQQGSYIRVEDLQALNTELATVRTKQRAEEPKFKGFEEAKAAAKADPEYAALFEQKPPIAPMVDHVKNVGDEEEKPNVAAA